MLRNTLLDLLVTGSRSRLRAARSEKFPGPSTPAREQVLRLTRPPYYYSQGEFASQLEVDVRAIRGYEIRTPGPPPHFSGRCSMVAVGAEEIPSYDTLLADFARVIQPFLFRKIPANHLQ